MRIKKLGTPVVVGLLAAFISSPTVVAAEDIFSTEARTKLIRSVEIPAREPGLLQELNVREGDFVSEGDVLAKLDSELYDLTQAISLIEMEVAKARAENDVNKRFAEKSSDVSSKVLDRSKAAIERYSKSISRTELETLALEAQRDELSIEQATNEQDITTMEKQLADKKLEADTLKLKLRTIIAPFDGMVVEPLSQDGNVYPQQGEWVNVGQPILRIVDLKRLRVDADFPADRIDSSALGKSVKFVTTDTSGEERSYEGTITFVSPQISLLDTVRIRAEIANEDLKVRVGMKGKLKFDLDATDAN